MKAFSLSIIFLLILLSPSQIRAVYNCTNSNECLFLNVGQPYCLYSPFHQREICMKCNYTNFFKDCNCEMNSYCIIDPLSVIKKKILQKQKFQNKIHQKRKT